MKFKKTIIILIMLSVIIIGMNTNNITKAENITEEKIYCNATLEDEFTDNEILIVITNEESLKFSEYTVNSFNEINCTEVTDLTDGYEEKIEQQLNGTYEGNMPVNLETFNRILKLTLGFKSKEYVLSSIKELEKREEIKSAEPNYIENYSSLNEIDLPIDDYYYRGSQWGLDKINIIDAWNITTGSEDILVGVIDSGIDATHEDLVGKVDTTLSKSFSTDYPNPLVDEEGHGTNIAGVIGANKNPVGIVGICWNVKLVSLKVLYYYTDENGEEKASFNSIWISESINYAASKDIDILNCSFSDSIETTQELEAIQNYPGLVVCAASNNYNDNDLKPRYPANYTKTLPNVISVGATMLESGTEKIWKYVNSEGETKGSNYGKTTVDLFAPGSGIMTTIPIGLDNYGTIDGYEASTGTSIATPFVAGVAALLLAKNPHLTASQLKTAITSSTSVDLIPSLSEYCISGGRLNAKKALDAIHYPNLSYETYNGDYHRVICTCGYNGLEPHNFVLMTISTNEVTPNAVPGTLVCNECGTTKINGLNVSLSIYNNPIKNLYEEV